MRSLLVHRNGNFVQSTSPRWAGAFFEGFALSEIEAFLKEAGLVAVRSQRVLPAAAEAGKLTVALWLAEDPLRDGRDGVADQTSDTISRLLRPERGDLPGEIMPVGGPDSPLTEATTSPTLRPAAARVIREKSAERRSLSRLSLNSSIRASRDWRAPSSAMRPSQSRSGQAVLRTAAQDVPETP